jgi:hypothetical protein
MDVAMSTEGRDSQSSMIRAWIRHAYGAVLEFFHVPGKIREFEYVDPSTNETIYLATGARYSVLHVGSKRLFFDRITGRFDGTGTLFHERVVDRLQRLD